MKYSFKTSFKLIPLKVRISYKPDFRFKENKNHPIKQKLWNNKYFQLGVFKF